MAPTKQSSKTDVHPLVAKQQELIAAFDKETETMNELAAAFQAATAKGEAERTDEEKQSIANYRSASARKANRSAEIGQVQLDMRLANADGGEQIEFEEWVKPKTASATAKRPSVSKEQIENDLEKVGAIYNMPGADANVKHDCDVRINALLKQAKRAGYEVTDPRQ